MEALTFVQPYPDRMAPDKIHQGKHAPYITEAQEYSYKWGRVLRALLAEEESSDAFGELNLREYTDWLNNDFDVHHNDLGDVPVDVRARALNETNFHLMNWCMTDMWLPLASKQWDSNNDRTRSLNGAEFSFAFEGLEMYARRKKFIEQAGGTHALFEPEYEAIHNAYTGMMQEYDAAIVLIDFIRRHPNLTVLPAPLQFERTNKRINVDFVVADFVNMRAVGIQVKSRVRHEDTTGADPGRVVFIDGDIDLGNVRLARIHKSRSTQKLVAWPGIIAAKRMETFKAYGQAARQFSTDSWMRQLIGGNPRLLVERQMLARSLVGDIKVYHDDVARVIGNRILQKI